MITANRRASATIAFFIPQRCQRHSSLPRSGAPMDTEAADGVSSYQWKTKP